MREMAAKVTGAEGEQDTVYLIEEVNAATAKTEVAMEAGVKRSQVEFVQLVRL